MKTTGLSIQEAIQSGLSLRRPTWVNYVKARELSSCGIGDLDILAQDWQIKVPEVTITREKLAEAISEADKVYSCTSKDAQKLYVDFMCRKLGL